MMNRWLLVIVLAGLVTSVRADSDSTRMKLDEAKAAYEASSEKYRATRSWSIRSKRNGRRLTNGASCLRAHRWS